MRIAIYAHPKTPLPPLTRGSYVLLARLIIQRLVNRMGKEGS